MKVGNRNSNCRSIWMEGNFSWKVDLTILEVDDPTASDVVTEDYSLNRDSYNARESNIIDTRMTKE